MKRIVLCADDFGQDRAVDAGILRLLALGRLTAVSCLAGGPRMAEDAARLLEYAEVADLGLHLDLTGSGAAARPALRYLLVRAYAGALRGAAIGRRIEAQLDGFERLLRRAPDFVDGHHHVHQLPGVRRALLEVLGRRYPRSPPYVRSTLSQRPRGAKARVVALLGGWALARELARRGLPHNLDFAGLYSLDARAGYPGLVRAWLDRVADGALLLCHPGEEGHEAGDPIAATRAVELRFLASDEFAAACASAGVVLVRFSATVGSLER